MALKANVRSKKKEIAILSLKEFIKRYEISNQAEGKSPGTVRWYTEMLRAFTGYLDAKHGAHTLENYDMDTTRGYILYLRQKPKFEGHLAY